jgi:hypothetical protein
MFWALSCAPIDVKRPDVADLPPGQRLDDPVQGLAQRLKEFRSLRALASISYRGPEGKTSFDEAILVGRPERLRLETLSALGAVLVVTANGSEIAGLHPREGLFFRGQSTRSNLLRFTRIPLELEEVTALLMGLPPVPLEANWEVSSNLITRKLSDGGKEAVGFDPRLGIPTRWERRDPTGKTELTALFSEFSSSSGGPFPLRIAFEAAKEGIRLDIRYREPELNVELSPTLFIQEKPSYAKEIPIETLRK